MLNTKKSRSYKNLTILLTGATGYVGGRLLGILEEAGFLVKCLVRNSEGLLNKIDQNTEIITGDVFNKESLETALRGVDIAYYLIHSMETNEDFAEKDRQAAHNFGQAAQIAGVKKIIYLGGLGKKATSLSSHLSSRHEVGEILRSYTVPVIEFRASIVIGSGSLSFEIIRALTERLPIMIAPRWVSTLSQPIAIEDLLNYLKAAITLPITNNRIYEIGGSDKASYGDIMLEYAKQRKLKRIILPVPVLTPRLSSLWLGLVTPVYSRIGRKLIDSLPHETIVEDYSSKQDFNIQPLSMREAITRAIANEDRKYAQTRWSDAISSAGKQKNWAGVKLGSRIVDSRTASTNSSAKEAFEPIRKIGGKNGWYYANWLWQIRGFIDLLVGGVGLRRGRKDQDYVQAGETLDFWRVEKFEPDRLLRLRAEMKVPGKAWLEFEVTPTKSGSIVRQTAIFYPFGLFGLLYWYLLYPLHQFIFAGMLRNIISRAEEENNSTNIDSKISFSKKETLLAKAKYHAK